MTEPRKTPRTDDAAKKRTWAGLVRSHRALEIETQELAESLDYVMDRLVDRHETDQAAIAARATLSRHRAKQEVQS